MSAYFTRTMSWPAYPYRADLPPLLCFTVPAESVMMTSRHLQVSRGLKVTLRVPQVEMDPSDRSTWQRPYRFDLGQHGLPAGRFGSGTRNRWAAP